MNRIAQLQDVTPLRTAWERIFISTDPFGMPFSGRFTDVLPFFPTDGYHLTQTQYAAVCDAALKQGDSAFCLSVIEYEGGAFWNCGHHWWCRFPSYEEYRALPLVLENSLYSPHGDWGLLVSHEDHALVAGGAAFLEELRRSYTAFSQDLRELKATWAGKPNAEWILRVFPDSTD
jgi:hypothetical protein